MSPLALALALTLSPAAAPDATGAPDAKVERTKEKRVRAAKAKKRRQRRRAAKRDLAEVLALEPPAEMAAGKPLPTAPALAGAIAPPANAVPAAGKTASTATSSAPSGLTIPKTSLSLAGLMWPGLLLCTLAGAVVFFRRKRTSTRSLDVVEAVSVGKGRDLVVVDVGGSRMLLGCTDGGISVLEKSLPRHVPRSAPNVHERGAAKEGSVAAALVQALRGSVSRLKGGISNTAAFEQHLESTEGAPCSEQEELARKLQARINNRQEVTNPGFELGRLSGRGKAVRA